MVPWLPGREAEMMDKYDEQARTVMYEVLGHLLGDGTFPVDGVKVIATALRSAAPSGGARADEIEKAARHLVTWWFMPLVETEGYGEPFLKSLNAVHDALALSTPAPISDRYKKWLKSQTGAIGDCIPTPPPGAVEEAKQACVNVCRNIAQSYAEPDSERVRLVLAAFGGARDAGKRLLAAEGEGEGE